MKTLFRSLKNPVNLAIASGMMALYSYKNMKSSEMEPMGVKFNSGVCSMPHP